MDKANIILLHGMGRTGRSLRKTERAFKKLDYHVVNQGYPSTSRRQGIEELAHNFIPQALAECGLGKPVHFVTHSLGGILLRMYLQSHTLPPGSRAVMLAPPNQGSEVAEVMRAWFLYRWLMGKPGQQLGTGIGSIPLALKPIDLEIGIITGNFSIEPWFSRLLAGENDGKVSVSGAKLENARDFLVVPHSHSFIMQKERVVQETIHFIQHGFFTHTF